MSREVTNLLRALLGGAAAPRNGVLGDYPTITAIAGTFTATLNTTFGSPVTGFHNAVSSDADQGSYRVLRGAVPVTLAFAAPAASPRIDLVIMSHATVDSGSQVRNILVDPVARSVVPQLVPKTRDPVSTFSVVTGTAAAAPVAPTATAGTLALFRVFVPAGAADATTFQFARAAPVLLPAQSGGPVEHGPLITPVLSTLRPAGAPLDRGSVIITRNATLGTPAFWIDGELVRNTGTGSATVENDALSNPFDPANVPALNGGAPALGAAAVFGKAAYLYAYGGRQNPHPSGIGFVVSLTQPRADGTPTSAVRVSPFGSGTVDLQPGGSVVFLCPVHYGQGNGAGTLPDLGGSDFIQQSFSGDGVMFPYGIAAWSNAGFTNLSVPALTGDAAEILTTLNLTTGDWRPRYTGGDPDLVTALLIQQRAQFNADAGNVPTLLRQFVDVRKPNTNVSQGVTIVTSAAAANRRSYAGVQTFPTVAGETYRAVAYGQHWLEIAGLDTLVASVSAANAFAQVGGAGAGDWASITVALEVIGYKLAYMPRGRF